jgi:hypothetical protein
MIRLRIPVWSRLNRPQRILALVVGLIVVLYVMTVGWGGRGGGVDLADPPAFIEGLGDLFGGPEAVDPADLSGSCLPTGAASGGDHLLIDEWCYLDIAARDVDLRELRVTAVDAVQIEAPVPRSDETGTKDLDPGEEARVSVERQGGRITVTCRSAGTCAIRLG